MIVAPVGHELALPLMHSFPDAPNPGGTGPSPIRQSSSSIFVPRAGYDASHSAQAIKIAATRNSAVNWRLTNPDDSPSKAQQPSLRGMSMDDLPVEGPSPVVDEFEQVFAPIGKALVKADFNGTMHWRYECSDTILTTPVIVSRSQEEHILLSCAGLLGGDIVLLNAATGDVTDMAEGFLTLFSSPIADDENVYFGSSDGKLHARRIGDLSTSAWESGPATLDGAVYGSPLLTTDTSSPKPSSSGTMLVVATTAGSVYTFTPSNGVAVAHSLVATGPIVSTPAASSDGSLLFVASMDFKVHVLDSHALKEACAYSTAYMVTSSPAVDAQGNVYVASEDNFLHAFNGPTCTGLWKQPMFGGSTPALDGTGALFVGAGLNFTAWETSSGSPLWHFDTTGETFYSPSIGPNGTVYVTTEQGSLYSLGLTYTSAIFHYRRGMGLATVNCTSPEAREELQFVCRQEPFFGDGGGGDANLTAVVRHACTVLRYLQDGLDPYGRPDNFVYALQYSEYEGLLQPFITVLQDYDTFLDNYLDEKGSLEEKVEQAKQAIEQNIQYRVNWENKLQQEGERLVAMSAELASIELRLETLQAVLNSSVHWFAKQWLEESIHFMEAALQNYEAGCKEFDDAVNEMGHAVGSIFNPFAWGSIGDDVKEAMQDLESGIEHIIDAALFGVYGVELAEAWGTLKAVWMTAKSIERTNDWLIGENHTLPEEIPALTNDKIDVQFLQRYMDVAKAQLEAAPGGNLVQWEIEDFINLSQSFIATVFSWWQTYYKYQSVQRTLQAIEMHGQELRNQLYNEEQHVAGVYGAAQAIRAQKDQQGFLMLQIAHDMAQQFKYWALQEFELDLPPNPSSDDFNYLLQRFQTDVQNVLQRHQDQTVLWANYHLRRSDNPDAFRDFDTKGSVQFSIMVPNSTRYTDVRTLNYRAFFLPTSEVSSPGVMNLKVEHDPPFEFLAANGQRWNFTNKGIVDSGLWVNGSSLCPVSHKKCEPPQCSTYINLSPYGTWTVGLYDENDPIIRNRSAITEVMMQFQISFEELPSGDDVVFARDEQHQIPAVPCCECD